MSEPVTKQGAHGTLYRYRTIYGDGLDAGFTPQPWSCWAYNAEHAERMFDESSADDGFQRLEPFKRVTRS